MHNLFQIILRDQYQKLPPAVQRFHEIRLGQFHGRADVKGSTGWLARALRKLSDFPPPASDVPLTVSIIRTEVQDRWLRQFGHHRFSSTLSRINRQNLLSENFGMFSFHFTLLVYNNRINWNFVGWEFAGMPMPDLLAPDVTVWEGANAAGNYEFCLQVRFPLIGMLMDYCGWLATTTVVEPATALPAAAP